ncbi:hypothetical protein BGZ65_001890 [Modicella reniformis]|uniref:Uncharacterized protein n=1 Tax=Modicella reniformis TaxID=1440133 RepID=A0A9P6LTE1_9FUNG|nr:hypothetical protein BGZ65_001890 [Modicella reniformis]
MPFLGLTGETGFDEQLRPNELLLTKKRDRGERIVWTPEEDECLRAAVQLYGDKTEKWAKIAACVPGRTNKNCRKRWFHSLDPKLKKGPWTEEEDHLLKTGVQMFKGQWSKIAEQIPGRTDDQCAKRWREGLDPLIDRAAWTQEDDLLLLQRFEEFGSQWQKIALAFPGRPGLHCRNRWRKLQRNLNQMKRVNKRRILGTAGDHAAIISETRRLEALLDTHNDDLESDANHLHNMDDVLLLQDAFLDDDFALEHGILLEDDGTMSLVKDKDDQQDLTETDDEKPYGCAVDECSFVSSSPSLLFYHFKASHSGTKVEKPFKCTVPGCETRKRYKNINGLQYHVTHAKNSPGHAIQGQLPAGEDTAELSRMARTTRQSTPNTTTNTKIDTPQSGAPSPDNELFITMPAATFDPSKIAHSNPPTLAEIQLQLHQSKQDHPPPTSVIVHLSRNAFNVPHSVSSIEGSVASSEASSGSSSPQTQRTMFCCPELGCGQSYHQIHGLNAHMANSHGHQAMTMRSDDTMYGPDAMIIPQEDPTDFDIDMTELVSGTSSPMDASLLQHQLDCTEHMSLDPSSIPRTSQDSGGNNNSTIMGNNPGFGMLAGKDPLFHNHIAGPLQNMMHFGTHANAIVHESALIQVVSAAILPSTGVAGIGTISGGVNPTAGAIILTSSPVALSVPQPSKSSKAQPSRSTPKRFACSSPNCKRSYATAANLSNHIRNDHPELYASGGGGNGNSISSGSTLIQRTSAFMEIPHSPDSFREEGDLPNKPYKCLVPGCGKGYTNINRLKNHLLQTHGSTPKTNSAA